MTHYQVVLTVGSTRFTPLVHAFLAEQSLEAIAALGVRTVLAQVGSSDLPSGWHQGKNEERYGLQVQVVRYMPELEEHVGTAELVVSHAGAGSILSFVRPKIDPSTRSTRHLVLVPNSTLMDSHQADLADAFTSKGWAHVAPTAADLSRVLQTLSDTNKPAVSMSYPSFDPNKIATILDQTLGYA